MDNQGLKTRIGYLGHVLDKRSTTGRGTQKELLETFGKELTELLREWDTRQCERDSRVEWSRTVLEQVKSEGQVAQPLLVQSKIDILTLVRARRSVRRWLPTDVDQSLIDQMLEAARWAPSSCNRQTSMIVVMRAQGCKEAAAGLNEKFLKNAPVLMLVGVDFRAYTPAERYGGAPFLDAAAAIQNMLLVGHGLGLGCLWAKASVEDWEYRPENYYKLKKVLNLPTYFRPISIVAVGCPAKSPLAPARKEIKDFVTYESAGFPLDNFPEWRPSVARRIAMAKAGLKRRLGRLLKTASTRARAAKRHG